MGILLLGATQSPATNTSRVLINVPHDGQVYLNLAKAWPIALTPGSANQTSDGYPVNGVLGASVSTNMAFPQGYFGKFAWQWTGTGGMDMTGAPWIVYSGGLAVYPNSSAVTDGAGGFIIGNGAGTGIANPLVIFNFGWNIQAVSNDGTGKILITTKAGYAYNTAYYNSIGQNVLISGTGTSADSATPWKIAFVNNDSFVLVGSTFVSGNASPAGTAIMDAQVEILALRGGQTFTNMSNLIICKYTNGTTDDYHDITVNGYIADTVLVNQLIYLMNAGTRGTPGWLRFMDLLTGGRGYNSDFANRMPVTAISYNPSRFNNGNWAGTISNTSDALSCADPSTSVWGGSAYIDGSVVQGAIASTNVAGYPTLAVGGHPAMPIYWNGHGNQHNIINIPSVAGAAGQVMGITFNAGGASYLNGGSNYTFHYTTVTADTGNATTFLINLGTALQADAVLTAASLQFNITTSTNEIYVFGPTPHANGTTGAVGNAMLVTYSGTPTCNLYRISPSSMATTGSTFVFNALLNGWVWFDGGIGSNIPLEVLIDFCNRVGAHCYFNWDFTTSAFVTSVTNFFAANLNSGLKFGTEELNEVWNPGTEPHFAASSFGSCLGWNYNLGQASLGILGLRTVQYAAISRAAWAGAGKPAANHVVCSQIPIFGTNVGGDVYNYQLIGTLLNGTTWPLYGSYGGLGATATANHDTQGTRPIDASDYIGCAPYWGSPWFGGQAGGSQAGTFGAIVGTVAQNAPMLQASFDYVNGSAATAYASLVSQFNGTTLRADFDTGNVMGPIHAGVQGTSYDDVFSGLEAIAAAFDSYRTTGGGSPLAAGSNKLGIICYEGGPNWAMGADPNNGVNSAVGSPSSADITALTTAFTNLGWTTGQLIPYTLSGTGNMTEVATNILNMAQAWKYDASYKTFIKTSYYQKMYNYSGANREVHPAQYGYNASQWGLFPGLYSAGNQYMNYDAIHEWNA
jgi:hypothetical protein